MKKIFLIIMILGIGNGLLLADNFTRNELGKIETVGIGEASQTTDPYIIKMNQSDRIEKCRERLKDNLYIKSFYKNYNEALQIASVACADQFQRMNK